MCTIRIEALIAMSAAGHYFSRTCLRGCRLQLISQNSSYRDSNYFEYSARGYADILPYMLLTCWEVMGETAGEYFPQFWIIQVNPHEPEQALSDSKWGDFLKGRFETLAHGRDERARLLSEWWTTWASINGGQIPTIARWLGKQLSRGYETPRPYPYQIAPQEYVNTPPFDPVLGWEFENSEKQNWFGSCP